VTGAKPSPSLPELAPLSVQGLPNVIVSYWYGVFAPVGTPPPILNKIRDSLKKVFDDTDMRQKLAGAGLDSLWMDGNELTAAVRADLDKYTRVVKTAGIKPE
jgi:tripartite-type tricarboxylate transporter receptor subunit TctC